MDISLKKIEHLAHLARIKLTHRQKKNLQKDLKEILDYVEKLNEVKTKDVKAMDNVTGLKNVAREDKGLLEKEVKNSQRENIREEVPSKKDGYVKIPRVLER